MSADLQKAYEFADLSGYSPKQRFLIRAADLTFYRLIQAIGQTTHFDVTGWEHFEQIERGGRQPIICFWHSQIFLGTYFFRRRRIVVMTSQSFDGEYIARFIQRFGYGAARGSSTRGGIGALVEMIKLMRQGASAAFTVDGPKGARHIVKEGAILLAKKTGNPLLPFTVTAKNRWRLEKSWDKMEIPRPFTRARLEIAAPIYVAPDADETEIAIKRDELQKVLDKLTADGERWRMNSKHD